MEIHSMVYNFIMIAGKIVMGIDYSYFLRNNLCMNMLAV